MSITAAQLKVDVIADTTDAERGVGSFGDKLNNTAKNLAVTGTGLSLAVTAPLLGIAKAGLDSAMEFEANLNVLQQVVGATQGEMESMQAEALRLGAVTSFSAGGASAAMLELGKAGMGTEDIMGSIAGVMDLAAAGGIGLAQAAGITANTINAFGLEAADASRIANLFAGAANASSADVADLAIGVQNAGFAFAAAGWPVEDLAASLAILTNVGLTGSDASTALKNAIMQMISPTQQAKDQADALGVSFFDASGTMLPLAQIVDDLNNAFVGMSDEQRNAALATMFMSDGMKAMIPLLDQGGAGITDMVETVSEAGQASAAAAARMSGLTGAIDYFSGSVDSFLIGAGLPFLATLGGLVRGAADALTTFSELPAPITNAALAFVAVLAAAGPLMLAVSGLTAAFAFLISPIGLVVVGVAALGAAFATNFMGIRDRTMEAVAAIQSWSVAAYEAFASSAQVQGAIAAIPGVMAQVQTVAVGAAAAARLAWAAMTGEGMNMTAVQGLTSQITAAFGPQAIGYIGQFTAAMSNGAAQIQAVAQQIGAFLAPAFGRVQESLGGLLGGLLELSPQFSALFAAAQPVLGGILTAVGSVAQALGVGLVGALSLVANLFAATIGQLPNLIGAMISQMTLMLNSISTIVGGVVQIVKSLMEGDWAGAWAGGEQIVFGFVGFITGTLSNLGSVITTMYRVLRDTVVNTLSDMGIDVLPQIQAIEGAVRGFWEWLTTLDMGAVIGDISSGFVGVVSSLLSWRVPGLSDLMEWEWPGFPEWNPETPQWVTDLIDWLPEPPEWVTSLIAWVALLPDWVTSLIAWIPNVPQWVTNLIAWMPDVPDWVTSLTLWSPSMPDWIDNFLNWSPSTPGWVQKLLDWIPSIPGFASGTSSAPGGMALVGERGPELIDLPRGSRVYNNRETSAMMAGGGGNGLTMHVHIGSINSEMDVHETAATLAREFQRRMRG